MGVQISPSILSADFTDLAADVARIAPSADWVHVDVMDNHFVPNLTIGLPVFESLAAATDLPLDAHLMIEDPDRWAPAYAEAGAGSVTFHAEAAKAPVRLARELRAKGARASMALKPATSVEPYADMLGELDMLLIMTVEPGFGGQKFLDACLPKIRRARELVSEAGLELWLQVDGGVSLETIERCAEAGADVFVAGSAVYSAEDPDAMVAELRAKAAAVDDIHATARAMPHVSVERPEKNPVYQVGSKSFVFFRTPRPDAYDPETGERYDDVVVIWVASEGDKQALLQDERLPFFTTPHFDGHPSVLLRSSRVGEIDREELVEIIEEAWLAQASDRRGRAWLASRDLEP